MNEEQISKSEASGQVMSMCRRLAHLYIAFAKTLMEEAGHEEVEKLILRAISRYGREIGRRSERKWRSEDYLRQ
jgi:hypothetical protein